MFALQCTTVSRTFGSVRALDLVSLSVDTGETFAVVGPDGAGKTTLLRTLAGRMRPDTGTVTVCGYDSVRDRRAIKERIGYLSQGFSLYRDLTIDENIAFFARIHGIRHFHDRRKRLLEFTRLTPFKRRLAGRLSGGMKKKLALSCALIHQPELLLLDEPTTGVDPVSRRDFWVILGDLRREGLTIVVSTPYMDEAERCSRVGLLQKGRFLAIDVPEAIRQRAPGVMFEAICSQPREAQRRLRSLTGESIQTYGDRIHVTLSAGGTRQDVAKLLSRAGIAAERVRPVEPSLEDVYISLVEAGQ